MEEQKDVEILKLIKKLNLSVSVNVDRMFAEYGLTASQCEVLDYLLDRMDDEVFSTDLHVDLGTSRASVSMILKRLRQKGYVIFRSSLEDDRRKRIYLTERSCRMKQKIDEKAKVIDTCLYRGFTDWERVEMKRLLRNMLKNLKAADEMSGETCTWEQTAGGKTAAINSQAGGQEQDGGRSKITIKRRPQYDKSIDESGEAV